MNTPRLNKLDIGVAAIGDVLDINCWSNIPYYFFTTGQNLGLFKNPFRLQFQDFSLSQKAWNLTRLLTGHGLGGYQYSDVFLFKAENSFPLDYLQGQVISFNQVFPRAKTIESAGGLMYYYIDSTLYDLFNDPFYRFKLNEKSKKEALIKEKENYLRARYIVTMGSWVKKSLIDFYHIPEEKIKCILPGANLILPQDFKPKLWKEGAGIDRDFVLGFVGVDWERKGLPLLICLKNKLKEKGYKIRIKVIGASPETYKQDMDIDFLGFIDKQNQMDLFIREISSCDLGCLFSKGEAFGISTLEFIMTGVPVTGFYHQGLLDSLFPEVSLQIGMDENLESIVQKFEYYLSNPEVQKSKYDHLPYFRERVSWERTIKEWSKILISPLS